MKSKLLKQPFLWIGLISLLLALIWAVGYTVLNPGIKVLSQMEKAINQENAAELYDCFTPEESALLQGGGMLLGEETIFQEIKGDGDSVCILPIDEVVENESEQAVDAFFVIYNNEIPCEAELSTVHIVEQDGKQYIRE